VVVTAVAAAAVLCLHAPVASGLAFLLAGCFALALGVPAMTLARRLALAAPVVALFVLPLPFLLRGPEAEWTGCGISVSAHGVRVATTLAGKMVALLFLLQALMGRVPMHDLLKALRGLRVPGVLVQLLALGYRYLFVLHDELGHLRVALRTRGYRNRASWHSYRTIGHVAGMLLVRGHDRSERVGQAMRCRGFAGEFPSLTEFRTRRRDIALALCVVAAALSLVGFDRFVG
jgi:cobalt/nickel transport system permease protein